MSSCSLREYLPTHPIQLKNAISRASGDAVPWVPEVRHNDVLDICEIERGEELRTSTVTVSSVSYHGWYSKIVVRDGGRFRSVLLYRDGPAEWGVVKIRLISRLFPRREPDEDGEAKRGRKCNPVECASCGDTAHIFTRGICVACMAKAHRKVKNIPSV